MDVRDELGASPDDIPKRWLRAGIVDVVTAENTGPENGKIIV
jgi:hypothetical protein